MFIKGYITTHDYGSSDINKRFLGSFIPNNYLVDGNLQIKAGKTRSFPVADLFYFLESKKLNMLLIRYEPNKQERTFKIIEVYFVKLNSSFFNYIVTKHFNFFKYISSLPKSCKKNSKKLNKKKCIEKLKFFSYTHKRTRWQGLLNIKALIKFLEENKTYGSVERIELKNSCFSFCGVEISPIKMSF